MNKTGYQLKRHKPSTVIADKNRPVLTLGIRPRSVAITCIVCDQPKLVTRSGVMTCSTRCRVAWHRLSPVEQEEIKQNRRLADELASS